jgi:hypothetical protein
MSNQNINNSNISILNQHAFEEAAVEIKQLQDKIDDKLKEKCPDELESHENLLFKEISSTIIKILTDTSTQEAFRELQNKIGTDISKELVELISTVTTFATYNAIAFYDMTVKEQISENFTEWGKTIMKHDSDINVMAAKIGDIEKKSIVSKLQNIVDNDVI